MIYAWIRSTSSLCSITNKSLPNHWKSLELAKWNLVILCHVLDIYNRDREYCKWKSMLVWQTKPQSPPPKKEHVFVLLPPTKALSGAATTAVDNGLRRDHHRQGPMSRKLSPIIVLQKLAYWRPCCCRLSTHLDMIYKGDGFLSPSPPGFASPQEMHFWLSDSLNLIIHNT